MKPSRFEYRRPRSLEEALKLLQEHGPGATVLAGGQSLVPMLNLRVAQPELLIDINRLPDLNVIAAKNGRLSIGALARHNDVLRSETVRNNAPLLVQALTHVAHEAIRNRGTLGGSLALADPAAEMPACAVCLEARIVAASSRGERTIAAGEFFQGIYTTALEPDEIIVRVEFSVANPGSRFRFDEISRRHGDFAICGLAACVEFDRNKVSECRIVFLGLETSPRRMTAVEDLLIGTNLQESDLNAAIAALTKNVEPLEGGEYPPQYRVHIAGQLLSRTMRSLALSEIGDLR